MNVRQNAQVIVTQTILSCYDNSRTNILEYSGPSYGSYFRKSNGISWCGAKGYLGTQYSYGDARATDMCDDGTVNVGQIINEEHKPEEVFSVGFGFLQGDVIAGREWGMLCRLCRFLKR
jgi:hypothetical protein